MQLTTPRRAVLSTIAAIGIVGALFAPAAGAKGKDDAPGQAKKADAAQVESKGKGASAPTYTEDNDTNDGGTKNNVADSGDNAHPSGKDRSVEHGKSGNQGKAPSDPDDDGRGPDRSNGGPDKPNGKGGVDKADQDGNNGCGNDDDFEDDNEGHCGRQPKKDKPAKPAPDKPKAEKPRDDRPGKPAEGPKNDNKPDTPKGGDTGAPGKGETPDKPNKPGKPNKPHNPGNGNGGNHGNGTATITVVADCRSVSVTSSKDISHVVVVFADGTSRKFEGLSGHTWNRTFDKVVASATAKSATTRVTDVAGSCGSTGGATQEQCPAGMVDTNGSAPGGCTTPGCPAGMVDTNGSAAGGCVVPQQDQCPAGMVDTNGSAAGGCAAPGCPAGMVDTNGSAAGGCALPGTAEVPCPAGTTDTNGSMAGGCTTPDGVDLGTGSGGTTTGGAAGGEVLPNAAERPATVTAAAAGTAAVASGSGSGELFSVGSLAFTGADTLMLLAVAFGLLGLGFLLVRTSRRKAEVTR